MEKHKKLGYIGEEIAVKYLKNKGFTILERNFKSKYQKGPLIGEIDIIAKKDGIIHFVEVKTSQDEKQNNAIEPEAKVNSKKVQKIIKTAQYWLNENKAFRSSQWQIDILVVYLHQQNVGRIFENITL